ncbi:hypothetical protein [Antarctobacter jejuensis]|uniref:hypothetical protein n=1 Tax=Antarctobacter jejuensis TaxID=1439938 RepID=UPI003FD34F89
MFKPISVLLLSAFVLSSCGSVAESRLNPLNWFGRSESRPVQVAEDGTNPLIPSRRSSIFRAEQGADYLGWPLGEISDLVVERRPGGAIIRATAVADYQGAYDLKLVKVPEESTGGMLTYAFKGVQPQRARGTVASRTHTAAVWLTDNQLLGIRTVQVRGARNVRSVRR